MTEHIYGRRNVAEFLESLKKKGERPDDRIQQILLNRDSSPELMRLVESLKGLHITDTSRKDMDQLTGSKNHQGIILVLKSGKMTRKGLGEFTDYIQNHEGTILLLDRIQDAGNLGNILRTSECFGVKCVVIPEREAADITDAVIRISSGAVHHLEIFKVTNLRHCIEPLKKAGYWIVAADENGEEKPDLPEASKLALIMGNEKEGIKRILLEDSDFTIKIPMKGKVTSLNVAVTTGILLDRLLNRN